jgi:hypothetical protein
VTDVSAVAGPEHSGMDLSNVRERVLERASFYYFLRGEGRRVAG